MRKPCSGSPMTKKDTIQPEDMEFLEAAFAEASTGYAEGGIPIGSVIVHNGRIIGRGHNQRIQQGSVIRHGEMDAFENAGRQPAKVYRECTLYTTLSPCPMCSGAIILYGIRRVVIGENSSFLGAEGLLSANGVELAVMDHAGCRELMERYMAEHPEEWNEDIGE